MNYNQIPSSKIIKQTVASLIENGINAEVVDSKEAAKERVKKLIPAGSEVMTNTSITLQQAGIDDLIDKSEKYISIRKKLYSLDREKDSDKMQKLGAAPFYSLGSVHAITMDGKIIIASNTGSQLPGYAYGSSNVIWVVSVKKITKNLEDGLKRVYEYVLPLESERVKKAYGMNKSNVSKLLIINKEVNPERIRIILVKEDLGF